MDATAIALFAVAISVAGLAFAHFFRTPKEDNNALASRLSTLETAHQTLALRFENSHATLDTMVENLEKSIEDLKKSIDKLTDKIGSTHKVSRRASS